MLVDPALCQDPGLRGHLAACAVVCGALHRVLLAGLPLTNRGLLTPALCLNPDLHGHRAVCVLVCGALRWAMLVGLPRTSHGMFAHPPSA